MDDPYSLSLETQKYTLTINPPLSIFQNEFIININIDFPITLVKSFKVEMMGRKRPFVHKIENYWFLTNLII